MDIKSVIRDYSLGNYVVNVYSFKHANYLNPVMNSLKTHFTQVPSQQIARGLMHVM